MGSHPLTSKPCTRTLGAALAAVLVCSAGSASAEPTDDNVYQISWGVIATSNSLPKADSHLIDSKDSNQQQAAALAPAPYTTPYSIPFPNRPTSPNKDFSVKKTQSGLNRHKLTDGRSLIGWKLSESLYFGHAKKDLGAVSLVWKTSTEQQVSLSTQGVKLTRRVK